MKHLAIFCVAYHTYDELQRFLQSVDVAAGLAQDLKVSVFVADNSEKNFQEISFQAEHLQLRVFAYHENLGYFGAAQRMMREVGVVGYDYVAVSNVDLTMRSDALVALSELKLQGNEGWLAVRLWSHLQQRDTNPSVMHRYSYRKLRAMRLMFKYPIVQYVYLNTLHRRKRLQRGRSEKPRQIYAGHGSFFLLTSAYFERCGMLDYPMFLYCEELYVAEECRLNGLTVQYLPQIALDDYEHVSTGRMKRSFYYKCNYEALNYILSKYYK